MSPYVQLPAAHPDLIVGLSVIFTAAVIVGSVLDIKLAGYVRRTWHTVPHRLRRIGEKTWSSGATARLGLGLGCVFLLLSIATQSRLLPPWNETETIQPSALLAQSLALPLSGLAMMLAWWPRRQSPRPRAGMSVGHGVGAGILLYLAAIPPVIASAAVHGTLLRAIGYPVEPQDVVTLLADGALPLWCQVYFLFLAIVLAPLFEETLFRGVLLPVLVKAASPMLAIVFTSLAFAAVHFHVPAAAPLFVFATIMSAGYLWTGSLVVPITLHAVFNGVNLTLLYLIRGTGLL